MTEQETREKIVEVLKKSREEWEIITPSIGILDEPRVDIEIDKLADALIAAGLGFKDKHRVFVQNAPLLPYNDDDVYFVPNTQPKITQLYGDEEVEQIVKERDEYKHRAEVAERALMTVCTNVVKDEEDDLAIEPRARVLYKAYLKQAEKELTEEK